MTTRSTEFNYLDCEKIDGKLVNAYIDASLNEENPTELKIETTWGDSTIDLTDAIKAGETVTTLELVPTDGEKQSLQFSREDGEVDCINGDDLSRIISMTKLKDVDQEFMPTDGDVYIFEAKDNKFHAFNLNAALDAIGSSIENLNNVVNNIQTLANRVTSVEQNISSINQKLTPPNGAPEDVSVAFGNINAYGDNTGADLKTSGIYTHDPDNNVTNDLFFE